MKQILQSLKTGKTSLVDVPSPYVKPGAVLIRTRRSLISSGTEKMLVEFGKASLIDKARKQPEKVSAVFDKIKTDGLLSTVSAVRSKLDQLLALGYCNVGVVAAVGSGVTAFQVGDRVVSNGAHAEMVTVPKNLCCKIPHNVHDDHAAFTVLGAIALQGIRLAQPTLGEAFVVMGLGMIGLLAVQLLRAHGCRVLGMDIAGDKVELAKQLGVDALHMTDSSDLIAYANRFSRRRGVDGVLITAATSSNKPIHQAAQMCRKRGRIILTGVAGLELARADFYEKELSFQVSCSYGPGRYDEHYEEQGHDYPAGWVRWTEQRNFEAFLDMLAQQRLDIEQLISHRFAITAAQEAYDLLVSETQSLGILISYPGDEPAVSDRISLRAPASKGESNVCLGFIGAGNYANRILIPAFKKTPAEFNTIACASGVSGTLAGSKFGFATVTTNTEHIFANNAINAVVIASRHDSHAQFVCRALQDHKHVFVEKPLCLTHTELAQIAAQLARSNGMLMIGFNRRFAPHIARIQHLLNDIREPKTFIMTVNAGDIPLDHWTQNKAVGGGRIVGEACHFVDLLRYLANSPINDYSVTKLNHVPNRDDKVSITLGFEDGSFGVIHYLANGHRAFPKERLEIFAAGKVLQLDNFRRLRGFGWRNFSKMNLWRQDKGQNECARQFVHAIMHALPAPIPVTELIEVMRVTLDIAALS